MPASFSYYPAYAVWIKSSFYPPFMQSLARTASSRNKEKPSSITVYETCREYRFGMCKKGKYNNPQCLSN